MNIDRPSDSINSSCTSKYFSVNPVMDESLSDFQEKKSSCVGPKKTEKASSSKAKPKKAIKRIRGQKDIRTALKSKKNELIAYANDFDKICKKSGIDVDSEQLQLAIALSKSIQQSETNADNESQSSTTLTSQERTGKIRTTLQEYGFKVPEIKITKSRKFKHRKQYKLLLTTQAEKQQVISDKYSQVLFGNLTAKIIEDDVYSDISNAHLYNIASNIDYNVVKSDSIYFVEDLIEKSPSAIGCMLRNWSEIPGRPASPKLEPFDIHFDKIECSQVELDSILSGTLKSAQDIVKSKFNLLFEIKTKNIDFNNTAISNSTMDTNTIVIIDEVQARVNPNFIIDGSIIKPHIKKYDIPVETIDIEAPLAPTQIRSCSPDIFDDEVSSIMDSSKQIDIISQESSKITKVNDFMDLTECVNIVSQRNLGVQNTSLSQKPLSQLSQGSNITKRKTNDFMEITDCVAGSSQPLLECNKIDLTQSVDHNMTVVVENSKENIESMDLTQSSKSSDDSLPFVQISGKDKSLDDTIILNHDEYDGLYYKPKTLTEENVVNNAKVGNKSNPKDIIDISPKVISINKAIDDTNNAIIIESEDDVGQNLDLSKEKVTTTMNSCVNNEEVATKFNTKTESFFEEFLYQHESSEEDGAGVKENNVYDCLKSVIDITVNENKQFGLSEIPEDKNNDIDLTQSSDSTEENVNIVDKPKSPQISYNTACLGKIGDVSIDYDDMYDNLVETYSSKSKQSNMSSNSVVYDIPDEEIQPRHSNSLASSNNSEVFEISDKEFDYSIHKSRQENFEIGGLSILDNLSSARSSKSTGIDSMSDSFLPMVNLKGTKVIAATLPTEGHCTNTNSSKDIAQSNQAPIQTPKNGKYIIKVDQVTPILDYSSLPTPERNKELDKYGLKPLKRRRAIQLLTHIYNQTHPIVASCSSDDLPSPSKRLKTSPTQTPRKSPRKLSKSPKKNAECYSKSPEKCKTGDIFNETDKENDVYKITSEMPDIRDIECCEEDWVFQKREKAKVHSCRVPLHIAFHNYLSCRRGLREAVLRYEPLNIDVVHKGMVASGHRYDPKDLLKYLDKKCITVKTADNNARNKKHY